MPELEDQEGNLGETISKVVGIAIRRRRWIVLPACVVALATIAVLWQLPNRYTSSATLVVVQQQVPQRYVVPNSTVDLTSALEAMKQEILSRTRLLKMIDDFGLYPKERQRLAPEQLVALMLKNIDITPIGERPQQRDFDAFSISFTTSTGLLAQQVTSTLTSLFTNEYLRSREEQSSTTTQFLTDQLEAKRKKLEEQEQRLRDFKLKYVGELPEQQAGNLGILTGLQNRLQNTQSGLARAQQQRVYLESLLAESRRQGASGPISLTPGGPVPNRPLTPLETAQADLARLESQKAQLLTRYKADYPDVTKVEREIDVVSKTVQRLKAAALPPAKEEAPAVAARTSRPAASSADPSDDPAVAQLKSQLEANRVEIDTLSRDEKQLRAQIGQYESRLNQTPIREQQQAAIVRDTEALRLEYSDLQKKEQESQLATSLEKQQGGQQFRLIDAASLPSVPSSPKRLKMSLGGIAGGLALGLGLALLMEMKDTSYHSEKDLTKHLAPPFVLGIPVLSTRAEDRRRYWRGAFEVLAGTVLVLAVMIAEFYVYRRG